MPKRSDGAGERAARRTRSPNGRWFPPASGLDALAPESGLRANLRIFPGRGGKRRAAARALLPAALHQRCRIRRLALKAASCNTYRRLPSDGSPPDTVHTLPFGLRLARRTRRSIGDRNWHSAQIRSLWLIFLFCPQTRHRRFLLMAALHCAKTYLWDAIQTIECSDWCNKCPRNFCAFANTASCRSFR